MPTIHHLAVDAALYDLETVQRAAHALSDRYLFKIDRDGLQWLVRLFALQEPSDSNEAEALFHARLIDEGLRRRISEDTRDFRESVIKLAFSSALKKPDAS